MATRLDASARPASLPSSLCRQLLASLAGSRLVQTVRSGLLRLLRTILGASLRAAPSRNSLCRRVVIRPWGSRLVRMAPSGLPSKVPATRSEGQSGIVRLHMAVNQKARLGGETETVALNGRRRTVLGESGRPCSAPERACFREYWPFREHLPLRY